MYELNTPKFIEMSTKSDLISFPGFLMRPNFEFHSNLITVFTTVNTVNLHLYCKTETSSLYLQTINNSN